MLEYQRLLLETPVERYNELYNQDPTFKEAVFLVWWCEE